MYDPSTGKQPTGQAETASDSVSAIFLICGIVNIFVLLMALFSVFGEACLERGCGCAGAGRRGAAAPAALPYRPALPRSRPNPLPDIIQKERELLEGPEGDPIYAINMPAPALPVSHGPAGTGSSPGADGTVGHTEVPRNAAAVLLEEGANASHLYGDVHADDLDAPKTVQVRTVCVWGEGGVLALVWCCQARMCMA